MPNQSPRTAAPPPVASETAYELRLRLHAARQHVPETINNLAANRRSVVLFDQLSTLASSMMDAGYSEPEVDAAGLKLWRAVVSATEAKRRSA